MKNVYSLLFCLIFFTALPAVSQAKKLNIVTTTPDLASLAEEIGGDFVKVTSIAMPTEDPHFVDARPSFMVKMNKADVFIEAGLQLEIGWLNTLLMGARNRKILPGKQGNILASTGIRPLQVPENTARSGGDLHSVGNPHFTIDPLNGKIVARNICDRLCLIDKKNCDYYKNNLKEFNSKIDKKLKEWQEMLEPFRGTKVVTYHRTYPYFLRRFNLNVVNTLEPKPGIAPSPHHINELIPMMKREGVKLILIEPYRERRTPELVANKTGAKVMILPIMPGGRKETEGYISLFDYNIKKIVLALKDI